MLIDIETLPVVSGRHEFLRIRSEVEICIIPITDASKDSHVESFMGHRGYKHLYSDGVGREYGHTSA